MIAVGGPQSRRCRVCRVHAGGATVPGCTICCVMARTTSSPDTSKRGKATNGRAAQSQTTTPVEPAWKRALLAIPRGMGSAVRSVTGVGEYDPAYRRDGLCFLMLVLAVFFCASEWFRVKGPLGVFLHAVASGLFGVMSVVVPVVLAIVAVRLMRNSGKDSGNPRVVAGWTLLMWSICSIIDVALIADEVFYDYALEPFDGNARLAGEPGVLTFALDGFSKMLAAPHAKVGWIQVSGPAEDVREALQRLDVIADDYLPMSDIIAGRIAGLLEAAPAQTMRVRGRVLGNLTTLRRLLANDPLGVTSLLRPEGGWNVLLRVPSVIDENELVLRMIADHRLTGQPGYFFDMASNGYLAVSLLPEPDEFARNIRAVLDTIDTMIGE